MGCTLGSNAHGGDEEELWRGDSPPVQSQQRPPPILGGPDGFSELSCLRAKGPVVHALQTKQSSGRRHDLGPSSPGCQPPTAQWLGD